MISGLELAKIVGVSRIYIHRLTRLGLIPAVDVSKPGAQRKRWVYTDETVARLRKHGLPKKGRKKRAAH